MNAVVKIWIALFAVVIIVRLTGDAAHAQPTSTPILISSSLRTEAERFRIELVGRDKQLAVATDFVQSSTLLQSIRTRETRIAVISLEEFLSLNPLETEIASSLGIPFTIPSWKRLRSFEASDAHAFMLASNTEVDYLGLSAIQLTPYYLIAHGRDAAISDMQGSEIEVYSEAALSFWRSAGLVPLLQTLISNEAAPPPPTRPVLRELSFSQLRQLDNLAVPSQYIPIPARVSMAVVLVNKTYWDRQEYSFRVALSRIIKEAAFKSTILFEADPFEGVARTALLQPREPTVEELARTHNAWIDKRPEASHQLHREYLNLIRANPKETPHDPFDEGDMERWPRSSVIKFITNRGGAGRAELTGVFSDARSGDVTCGTIEYTSNYTVSDTHFDSHSKIIEKLSGMLPCAEYVMRREGRTIIVIHGYRNSFASAALMTIRLKEAWGGDSNIILWSWPSRGEALDYGFDKESVIATRGLLRNFLERLSAGRAASVGILAHSMGSLLLGTALEDARIEFGRERFDSIVFAAPDIPTDLFSRDLTAALRSADRVVMYGCSRDSALRYSEWVNRSRRAGREAPAFAANNTQLEIIDYGGSKGGPNHSYVFERTRAGSDLQSLLQDGTAADRRRLERVDRLGSWFWRIAREE
jgi:hypothetical protein